MDFKDLKSKMEELKKTAKKIQEDENKSSNVDERFFKIKLDAAGNGSCLIRFLPQLDFSKAPYVKKTSHFIKASNKTLGFACPEYIEKGSCPACIEAKPYWDEYWAIRNAHGKDHPGCKEALKHANVYTANTQIITNILVIKNSADPETEGKVFLYSMPKTVFDKFKRKVMPSDELDEQVIVYDPLEGRNFKLSVFTKEINESTKMPDYSGSEFQDKTTAISDNEDIIMKVLNETYDLDKYLEESKPNIDDIKKKFAEFQKFLGKGSTIKEEKKFVKEENTNTQDDDFSKEIDEVEEISMDEIDDLFE